MGNEVVVENVGGTYDSSSGEVSGGTDATLDVRDGSYNFDLYDKRSYSTDENASTDTGSSSSSDAPQPSSYYISIYGDKDGAYGLLFRIGFVVDAQSPDATLNYYNWSPNQEPLDQWQKAWTEKTLSSGADNPNYLPQLNVKTGLANELLWVDEKPAEGKTYPTELAQAMAKNGQKYSFLPDPIDANGDIIWNSLTGYGTISQSDLDRIIPGFMADSVMAPKGLDESVMIKDAKANG